MPRPKMTQQEWYATYLMRFSEKQLTSDYTEDERAFLQEAYLNGVGERMQEGPTHGYRAALYAFLQMSLDYHRNPQR